MTGRTNGGGQEMVGLKGSNPEYRTVLALPCTVLLVHWTIHFVIHANKDGLFGLQQWDGTCGFHCAWVVGLLPKSGCFRSAVGAGRLASSWRGCLLRGLCRLVVATHCYKCSPRKRQPLSTQGYHLVLRYYLPWRRAPQTQQGSTRGQADTYIRTPRMYYGLVIWSTPGQRGAMCTA